MTLQEKMILYLNDSSNPAGVTLFEVQTIVFVRHELIKSPKQGSDILIFIVIIKFKPKGMYMYFYLGFSLSIILLYIQELEN